MTTETLESTLSPELVGVALHRFELVGEVRPLMSRNTQEFLMSVRNVDTELLLSVTVGFDEFAARYKDCFEKNPNQKFVSCFQWDLDGQPDPKVLSLWDFIYSSYYKGDEAFFSDDIMELNQASIQEVLLNIIDSKF